MKGVNAQFRFLDGDNYRAVVIEDNFSLLAYQEKSSKFYATSTLFSNSKVMASRKY